MEMVAITTGRIEEGRVDLRHNPPVCEKFFEGEDALEAVRGKLRGRG